MKKYILVLNGEKYATFTTYTDAEKAMTRIYDASDNDNDFIKYYGFMPSIQIIEIDA